MSNNELLSIDEQTLANIMNKRHRSTKSQFKNPPQPKFCIKEKSLDGREIYINILSYSRIAAQLSEFDPVSDNISCIRRENRLLIINIIINNFILTHINFFFHLRFLCMAEWRFDHTVRIKTLPSPSPLHLN